MLTPGGPPGAEIGKALPTAVTDTSVIRKIKKRVPELRFMVWTGGFCICLGRNRCRSDLNWKRKVQGISMKEAEKVL